MLFSTFALDIGKGKSKEVSISERHKGDIGPRCVMVQNGEGIRNWNTSIAGFCGHRGSDVVLDRPLKHLFGFTLLVEPHPVLSQ